MSVVAVSSASELDREGAAGSACSGQLAASACGPHARACAGGTRASPGLLAAGVSSILTMQVA